jgi:hypothetical protein
MCGLLPLEIAAMRVSTVVLVPMLVSVGLGLLVGVPAAAIPTAAVLVPMLVPPMLVPMLVPPMLVPMLVPTGLGLRVGVPGAVAVPSTAVGVPAAAVGVPVAAENAHTAKVDGQADAAEHDDLVGICHQICSVGASNTCELLDGVEHDGGANGDEETRVAQGSYNLGTLPAKRHFLSLLAERQLRHVVATDQGGNICEHVERICQHGERARHDAHDHFGKKVGAREEEHQRKLP